jgi:hypothetical protein
MPFLLLLEVRIFASYGHILPFIYFGFWWSHGTARFVVYRTCAKYRVIEYYRVCRFIDVILEYQIIHNTVKYANIDMCRP